MARFVLRVWLPDRPGELGKIASAIGSIGASLVGIDILEQSGGYAIDELVVDAVDSENAAEKLVVALTFLEGVNVENVRESIGDSDIVDPRVDALETAADLVEQDKSSGVLDILVQRCRHDMEADWVCVLEHGVKEPIASSGELPQVQWISAFLAGSRSSEAVASGNHGPEDIAWCDLKSINSALVIGRDGRPFRARERRQMWALARIADHHMLHLLRHE